MESDQWNIMSKYLVFQGIAAMLTIPSGILIEYCLYDKNFLNLNCVKKIEEMVSKTFKIRLIF